MGDVYHGLFRLIDPPDGMADITRDVLEACTFPWRRIVPALRRDPDRTVHVVWDDLGQQGVGLFYRHTWEIHLTTRYGRAEDDGDPFTFAHELGHLVDAATLDRLARDRLADLMHDSPGRWDGQTLNDDEHPWSHRQPHAERWRSANDYKFRLNEAFADLFVATFAPDVWEGHHPRFAHWTDDFGRVRDIVLDKEIVVFDDVPEDHPFRDDIEWLAEQGITVGYDDGTFRPDAPVTRQALAAFLHRYADR